MKTPCTEHPWYAQGNPWILEQREWTPAATNYSETIFTQSNGYMGIRGYTEEGGDDAASCREGYLAGVFAHTDEAALAQTRVTYDWPMLSMITLPEIFACMIELGGERFALAAGQIESFSRRLDMATGEVSREVTWRSPAGRVTRFAFRRFLSAARPELACQQITITALNWSGPASLTCAMDGTIPTRFRCGERTYPHIPQPLLENPRTSAHDGHTACLTVTTRGTGHEVCLASRIVAAAAVQDASTAAVACQVVGMELEQDHPLVVQRVVAVVSSRFAAAGKDVVAEALRLADDATRHGYDAELAASAAIWRARWDVADVVIDGPAIDQARARFSTFSMLQMAPFHTDTQSIPARGFAYNRYHGLYYWDSETFLLPQYLHTHPEVARNLLVFRHRTLDGAKRNAAHLGAPGAAFPWMTDSDDGTEQGPWNIGDYLWHQNADIAYAIDQYTRTTGDDIFMRDHGLEILAETSRFWMSRIEDDAEGVAHLHDTVGPDELDKHGKDNGYTSLMARRHLRLAVGWIGRMRRLYPQAVAALLDQLEVRDPEIQSWAATAGKLSAPNVPGMDIPLQDEFLLAKEPLDFTGLTADEGFAMRHTHRVVKQADIVLAMYLLQDEFTIEQMRAAYEFYEPMTLHFSSLSYNTHSILATKIGLHDQAYDYFRKAAGLDLDDLRGATKDGLHAAALGGTWQTIAYGFLGMRLLDDAIAFEPVLPACWNGISLKIAYRGYTLALEFTHDSQSIRVTGNGQDAKVILNGQPHTLADGLSISCSPVALADR